MRFICIMHEMLKKLIISKFYEAIYEYNDA